MYRGSLLENKVFTVYLACNYGNLFLKIFCSEKITNFLVSVFMSQQPLVQVDLKSAIVSESENVLKTKENYSPCFSLFTFKYSIKIFGVIHHVCKRTFP